MTAFKTTSMRIRGTSVEELEEAGLATDGLIESTAKLQSQIKALSGVDIMIDSETYKSTYQIMLEIAKVWDNISDINQAALLEALAGKRNSQVLMSVIQNLDDLTGSYEAAQNAAGAMEEANAIAMDTITGKTKALSASWQELSGNLLDSGIIKWFMDLAITVVNVVNDIDQATGGLAGQILLSVTAASALVVVLGTLRATAVAHGVTALVGAFQQLISVMTAAGPIAANGAGLLGLISPAGRAVMAISALITVGYNLYKAYRKANPTLDELKDQLSELTSECKDLDDQLKTNNERIAELQEQKSLTLVEDEELRKLETENALLTNQLAIKEGLRKYTEDEVSKKIVDKYGENSVRTHYISHKDQYGVEDGWYENDLEFLGTRIDQLTALENQIAAKTQELSLMSPEDEGYNIAKAGLESLKAEYKNLMTDVHDLYESIANDINQLPEDATGAAKDIQESFAKVEIKLGSLDGADSVTTATNLLNLAEYESVQKTLDAYNKSGALTGEVIANIYAAAKDDDPLKAFINDCIALDAIANASPASLQLLVDALYGVSSAASKTPQISLLSQMITDTEEDISVLGQAQKDMNELGVISVSTLKDIIDANGNLKKYLVQTANGYKLKTGALEGYLSAQKIEYQTSFTEAKQAAINVINSSGNAKIAIDASTASIKKRILALIAEAKIVKGMTGPVDDNTIHGAYFYDYHKKSEAVTELEKAYQDLLDAEKSVDEWESLEKNLRASYIDKSTTSSQSDPLKDDIENQIKILKHQREMHVITDAQYYDGLRAQMERYYVDTAKYEEEIWDLREELYNGYQELVDDWINDQNKAAERLGRQGMIVPQIDVYRDIIERIQSEIDKAYADGLDANSDYVQELEEQMLEASQNILDITKSVFDDFISYADDFNRWDNFGKDLDISKIEMLRAKLKSIQKLLDDGTISWEDYLDAYNEAAKSLYDTQKESIETIIDLTMELIEQEAEDEIEALEKQADAYDELIEKKKELLEKADDEADHEKKVAEAVREIAKLQSKISQLSLDDSREAAAQKAKLEEELYQKQLELADLQGDYALEQTLETLDKAQEANKETVDAEKEAIEKSIDTWVKKYEQAIDRIDNDWDGLYKDLLDYQEEYRDSIDGIDSFETAWRNVEDTIIDVNENIADSISSTIKGIEDIYQAIENVGVNPGTPNLDDDGAWDGTVSGGASSATSSKYSSLVSEKGRSIVQKMYNNSVKAASNPSLRDTLNQQNHDLAADYYWQTGDELYYNAPSGTWHIGDSYSDPFLYEVYGLKKYHTGGYVGNEGAINDREVLSVLEKGELVLTKGHQFNLKKILSDMYAMVKAMTSINLPSFSTSATSPNGNFNANVEVNITHNGSMTDDDAKRYGSIAGDAALKKLYAAFNKRGIR